MFGKVATNVFRPRVIGLCDRTHSIDASNVDLNALDMRRRLMLEESTFNFNPFVTMSDDVCILRSLARRHRILRGWNGVFPRTDIYLSSTTVGIAESSAECETESYHRCRFTGLTISHPYPSVISIQTQPEATF